MLELGDVSGANRAGTTMLDLMLGHGEGCFSCGEISVPVMWAHAMLRPQLTNVVFYVVTGIGLMAPHILKLARLQEEQPSLTTSRGGQPGSRQHFGG